EGRDLAIAARLLQQSLKDARREGRVAAGPLADKGDPVLAWHSLRVLALADHPLEQAERLLAQQQFPQARQLIVSDPPAIPQFLDFLEAELDRLFLAGIKGMPRDPRDRSNQLLKIGCIVQGCALAAQVLTQTTRRIARGPRTVVVERPVCPSDDSRSP